MKVVCYNQRGSHLDTVEIFLICKETIQGNQLEDKTYFCAYHKILCHAKRRKSIHQCCLLITTCAFYDIMVANCKKNSSIHTADPLIAQELHKKFFSILPLTVS
jgi:hypothetical protein